MSDASEKITLRLVQMEAVEAQADVRRLKSGDGGGTSGGMEARVTKLESELGALRLESAKAFGDIRVSLATIEERSKHMPTKWDVFLIVAAVVGFASTVIGVAAKMHG